MSVRDDTVVLLLGLLLMLLLFVVVLRLLLFTMFGPPLREAMESCDVVELTGSTAKIEATAPRTCRGDTLY